MRTFQPVFIRRMTVSALSALALSSSALVAHAASNASAEAQYKQDVANCNSGRTNQTKQVCLQEAGAARAAGPRNNLTDPGGYDRAAVQRCQRLPTSDRAACEAQMAGQGQTHGSVQGGGVLREMTIPVEPGTPGSRPGPAYAPGAAPTSGTMVPTPPAAGGMAPPPMAPAQPTPLPPLAPGVRY